MTNQTTPMTTTVPEAAPTITPSIAPVAPVKLPEVTAPIVPTKESAAQGDATKSGC